MNTSTKIAVGASTAILAAAVGVGVTAAATPDDNGTDVPITGDALRSASDAALANIGSGRVTGTEVGDEDSYYEVEVTLNDGTQVDVQLDQAFVVVSATPDVEDGDAAGPG